VGIVVLLAVDVTPLSGVINRGAGVFFELTQIEQDANASGRVDDGVSGDVAPVGPLADLACPPPDFIGGGVRAGMDSREVPGGGLRIY